MTEKKFLKLFDLKNLSFEEFEKKAEIFYYSRKKNHKFGASKNISNTLDKIHPEYKNDILKYLYWFLVENAAETLKYYYDHSINIDSESIYFTDLHVVNKKILKDGTTCYNGIHEKEKIRFLKNINFAQFFGITKYDKEAQFGAIATLKKMFEQYCIANSFVTPSIRKHLIDHSFDMFFSIFRLTHFKGSIFYPKTYYTILNTEFKGANLLTPVLDWNSYQLAFHNSPNWKHYVGIDVIPQVVENGRTMATEHNQRAGASLFPDEAMQKVDLYCTPSETLINDKAFMKQYKNYFDAVLFSPPYYDLEIYDSENQSTDTFKTYNDWLLGYWDTTVRLCLATMKPGARLGFTISNFTNVVTNEKNNITEDMAKIAGKHLKPIKHCKVEWNRFKFDNAGAKKMRDGNFDNLFIYEKT